MFPQRTAAIMDRIAEFVARDLCPLSIVEGDGFKQLSNYHEPGYKVPSCSHATTARLLLMLSAHLLLPLAMDLCI